MHDFNGLSFYGLSFLDLPAGAGGPVPLRRRHQDAVFELCDEYVW